MMLPPLLTLNNLSFAYEDQPLALNRVTVSISPGERIAVLGSNGAGKSTFFLCCNGVLQPQEGAISLHGEPVSRRKQDLNRLRQQVGMVFQDPNQQLIGATVEEEISFGPMNLALPPQEVSRRVEEALTLMGLEPLRQRPPHYLSGGEKRRLTIAGVLAMYPELIILDEPTAFLDGENARLLEETLGDLHRRGKALMVATHDLDFAYRWATRVLVFHQGSLVADNTPEAVFADIPLTKQLQLQLPIVIRLAAILEQRGLLRQGLQPPRSAEELLELLEE